MKPFEFTEDYHLGLPEIDAQHARLFDLFNSLIKVEQRGAAKEEVCLVVDELVEYIDIHFKFEEKFLEDSGYGSLEEHRAKHVAFVRRTIEFDKTFRSRDGDLSWDILLFLRKWLIDHIMVEDMEYAKVLKAQQV